MIDIAAVPLAEAKWPSAVRIIRSLHPPIDLFEDIADPADWPLIISAERKTNPRLMETIGNLDLVPPGRRAAGHGASYLMAPFTHISVDRPSRFSDGSFGVLRCDRLGRSQDPGTNRRARRPNGSRGADLRRDSWPDQGRRVRHISAACLFRLDWTSTSRTSPSASTAAKDRPCGRRFSDRPSLCRGRFFARSRVRSTRAPA